ncbi:DNA mismatch repair protein MLH3 [Glycine max]|nr:DNA mismatch repair protein MLH3 [Glycine max]
MASIKLLSEAVRSSLRSGIFLVDFTRVVEELVFNSLDARATKGETEKLKVSVFVSTGSCYLKVVDDGSGIPRDGMEMVGERYATSKFLNLVDLNASSENFGFRGEVLASISEVSLLEIVTKTYGRPNGYRKVLKGCKCLYLGIDDDRKEMGTTVVIRDLFYNQPVRRKYMQSSPNKVLQSIKNCVVWLALVCPNISFKVVDIEREDELFCTHSASSPLSLVTSGFGVEVTSSLHNLEVENDIIKLSGYISGPCNTVDTKGPVHKLMRQLANRFEHLNSWNTDEEFRNKKRTRCQPCPAYLLNLSCPRSLYDLAFEPSKTVKFKDWAPILNFIVKAIKQFWEENVACDPSNGATYMVEDQHHFSSIREDVDYLGVTIFKEKQSKGDFLLQTGYSGNLLDGSYAKCTSTVMRKHNSLLMHNSNSLLEGDNFFDGEIPAVESFNIDVPFDAPSSSHGRRFHKVEADVINESFEDDLLYNSCSGYGYDVKINEDLQQPFLKRCSTLGSILHEKALFVNDEYELQTDSFWSKQNAEEDYRSGKDLYAHPCPEVTKKLKMSKDSDFLVRALSEENCLPPDLCYSALQIGSSGSDDQLLNFEWHPDYQKPSSQASALGVCHTTDIEDDLGEISRYYKRIHHTKGKMIGNRQIGRVSNPAFNHQEASNFKYPQQSPVGLHHSTEEFLLQEFKINVKRTSEVLGDMQVNDITDIDGFESFNIQNSAPFGELISRGVQDSLDYGTKWRNCSPKITKNDKLANIQSQNNILDISSGFLHLAGDSLIPETISKKCLEDAKVLHQVDKKFILVVAGRTLAVIDQHAADERIRLEELCQKVLSGEAKAITYLGAEQELVCIYELENLMYCRRLVINYFIVIVKRLKTGAESAPFMLKILNPLEGVKLKLNDVDLLEFLQQVADTDGSSTMPPSVLRVLNLKACRGAIMFGDSLLPSECSFIVEELKHTSLCFQCAHGRPATVPLVNLEALHNQIARLRLMNECSSDECHGLRRHTVRVERAAQRLNSARGI